MRFTDTSTGHLRLEGVHIHLDARWRGIWTLEASSSTSSKPLRLGVLSKHSEFSSGASLYSNTCPSCGSFGVPISGVPCPSKRTSPHARFPCARDGSVHDGTRTKPVLVLDLSPSSPPPLVVATRSFGSASHVSVAPCPLVGVEVRGARVEVALGTSSPASSSCVPATLTLARAWYPAGRGLVSTPSSGGTAAAAWDGNRASWPALGVLLLRLLCRGRLCSGLCLTRLGKWVHRGGSRVRGSVRGSRGLCKGVDRSCAGCRRGRVVACRTRSSGWLSRLSCGRGSRGNWYWLASN